MTAPTRAGGHARRAPKAQVCSAELRSTVGNIYLTHNSGPTAKNYPRSSHSWPKIQWKTHVPIVYLSGRSRNTHFWLTMAADRNIQRYTHRLLCTKCFFYSLYGETFTLTVISLLHTLFVRVAVRWTSTLNVKVTNAQGNAPHTQRGAGTARGTFTLADFIQVGGSIHLTLLGVFITWFRLI